MTKETGDKRVRWRNFPSILPLARQHNSPPSSLITGVRTHVSHTQCICLYLFVAILIYIRRASGGAFVISAEPRTSSYVLDLPPELVNRQIHISRLKLHIQNDDERFPRREIRTFYDFGDDPETESLVDEIVDHEWRKNLPWFHVKWDQGDFTWEPLGNCRELKALDDYMLLVGARTFQELPKRTINGSKRLFRC
jgi:hypothetical protein